MNNSTLVLVQVVFRHGLRAPDHLVSYPGDPYEDVTFEPFGKGQLTKVGRKQCYDFGKELRDRYDTFLGPEYTESLLEAHSSEVGRARTTLQLVLAGLFPPTEKTRVADELNWIPAQFNYKPLRQDPLIGAMVLQMVNNVNHSQFKKSHNSIDVVRRVEEKLRWKIEHNSQLMMIYDIIRSQTDLGLERPEWAAGIYPEKLAEECQRYIEDNMAREGYLKNGSGELMQKILSDMEDRAKGDRKQAAKIVLYSGHDINIVALMKILEFPSLVWPLYMGSLTFELHKVCDEFYAKIIFIDGYLTAAQKSERILKLQTLKTPNKDGNAWTLPELRKHVEKYLK